MVIIASCCRKMFIHLAHLHLDIIKVLVVDDAPMNIDVLAGILQHEYQVKAAVRGRNQSLCRDHRKTKPAQNLRHFGILATEGPGVKIAPVRIFPA